MPAGENPPVGETVQPGDGVGRRYFQRGPEGSFGPSPFPRQPLMSPPGRPCPHSSLRAQAPSSGPAQRRQSPGPSCSPQPGPAPWRESQEARGQVRGQSHREDPISAAWGTCSLAHRAGRPQRQTPGSCPEPQLSQLYSSFLLPPGPPTTHAYPHPHCPPHRVLPFLTPQGWLCHMLYIPTVLHTYTHALCPALSCPGWQVKRRAY